VFAALMAAMVVYCAFYLRVGTDITNFLPVGSSSELAALSSELADSPLTRTVIVTVGAPDLAAAIAAARELSDALRDHPEVAWIRSQVEDSDLEQLYRLYFPRRLGFVSDRPEESLPERLADPALRERARSLRRRLASPASSFFEPLVAADPLGAFEDLVARLRAGESALRVVDGQLVTQDERYAVVLLGTRGSAFDSAIQGALLGELRAEAAAIAARRGNGLEFEVSAVGAYAVAAERSIKGDVYTIAVCSFVGVALLFGDFVGSLRGFLITSLPPLAGILVATTLALLIFGELDGLTMAFGASPMGIVTDYSNHLRLHHGLAAPPEAPQRTVAVLRPSLVLGALTTVASFVGLGLTPFPAFREMSFFAITGVLSGLGVSLWVLPSLLRRAPALPRRSAAFARRLDAAFRGLQVHPRAVLVAPVAVGALAFAAWPELEWSDDPSQLTRIDPELVEEDRRVRERVARLEGGHFVIALAPDEGSAVAVNDAIHARLTSSVAAGALDGFRSLHALLWSEELQRRNRAALAATPDLYERIDAAFTAEGFRPGALRPFGEALREPAPAPLRLSDLRAGPAADLLAPFVFDLGDRVAVVTYLRGLRDPGAVRTALAGLDDVHLLDQQGFVNDIYREFRETSLRQVLVGGALVALLLLLRYRAWRPVLAAFLPSVLVALIVLTALAWLGEPANLLHVMSLVMVMGMGVDYGIFCVDSVRSRERFGVTLLSLLLSCLTTALVFGMLALSSQPALRAIGVTAGIGIPLCFLLAPLTLAATRIVPGAGARDA
jgi:predicted exporter